LFNFLEITKSRLRKKILAYFFTNPTANLYLREIASILKEDPGNLSKEFNKLVKQGFFVSFLRGNQKYFSLNTKHPLHKELKSVVSKTIGVEGALRNTLSKISGITLAFIYGSFAGNKENSVSDIDLFIVGSPDKDMVMGKIEVVEKSLQREINYNIYPEKEFNERLKKMDSFLINIIKGRKIILKGALDGISRSA